MSEMDDHGIEPFTLRQRRGLILLCVAMIIAIIIGLIINRSFVDDPIPNQAERFIELQDRIDPNDADVALLAALPALGERRAMDIIEFREKVRSSRPHQIVFAQIDDLMQIKGIGVAITQQLAPYLRFPNEATSRPTD